MRRRLALALVLVAACNSPGKRHVVNGTLAEVALETAPNPYEAVIADGQFYWTDHSSLRSRPLSGGSTRVLAPDKRLITRVAVTRDDVVYADGQEAPQLEAVAKTGGTPRTLASGRALAKIATTDDMVFWVEEESEGTSNLMTVRPRDPSPTPSKVATVAGGPVLALHARDGAVLAVVGTATEYRFDLFDRSTSPARTIYRMPRTPTGEDLEEREELAIAMGTEHVFVTKSQSRLVAPAVDLFIVPRIGGPITTYEKKVCPWLGVVGDDVLFATSRGASCGREFPSNARFELWRHSIARRRTTNLYSSHVGSLFFQMAGPYSLFLHERVERPHEDGTAPQYDYRASLFTFDP